MLFDAKRSDIGRAPNLLPWGSAGRAETPPQRGWVPDGAAISGRMRPRGRSTPPGARICPPETAEQGARPKEATAGPAEGGANPRHGNRNGADKGKGASANGREKARSWRMPRRGRARGKGMIYARVWEGEPPTSAGWIALIGLAGALAPAPFRAGGKRG